MHPNYLIGKSRRSACCSNNNSVNEKEEGSTDELPTNPGLRVEKLLQLAYAMDLKVDKLEKDFLDTYGKGNKGPHVDNPDYVLYELSKFHTILFFFCTQFANGHV